MIKRKKEILGRHIILEINECYNKKLSDIGSIEKIMIEAALTTGAELREVVFQQFSNQRITGVVMTSEMLLTSQTCPEIGYAAVDLFSYSTNIDPSSTLDLITEKFEAKRTKIEEMKRGNIKEEKLSSLIHFC